MKLRTVTTLASLVLLLSSPAAFPAAGAAPQKATFAGGCFWCMVPAFDGLDGVKSVVSGYTGGLMPNPTYEEVSSGKTGHAEAVEITYDPAVIPYSRLLDVFWRNIDPTVKDRQFCDIGTQYRSAIFYHDGPVLRAGANQPISPYIRAQVGLLFSNLSPISTSGTVVVTDPGSGAQEYLQFVVYTDPSSTRVTPGFVFGGGLTAVIGKGWQLRTEVRDNLVQIATVAGPTSPGNDDPEIVNEWKNLWSIVLAADIVLEKKRGRRY